ncbi:MAG TPA: ricin-type beta-trefoil lectin domain protein [Micromonosporaceae bacterium]|jgi:hypothetical protein|nr:ricin-type beta-trefoil lectin domain protein [Micromonosporaceae bacterium]
MRKASIIGGLLATALSGLLLATSTPAGATHPVAGTRISDLDSRTFATASTTTKVVTMQPPISAAALQSWIFSTTTLGTQVRNVGTGGCLTPDPTTSTIPALIIQESCRGTANEYWRIVSVTSTSVMFRNVARSDGCMAIDATSPSLPTRLHLVRCQNDDRNQHFRLLT